MMERNEEDTVMYKRILALLCLVGLLICSTGCSFSLRDTVEGEDAPSLPSFHLSSTLICSVASIDVSHCTVTVLEDNSTYDKDDILYVTYETVADNQKLSVGDIVTFTYHYVSDVSVIDDTSHIAVDELTVLPEYTPPETTVKTTEETTA